MKTVMYVQYCAFFQLIHSYDCMNKYIWGLCLMLYESLKTWGLDIGLLYNRVTGDLVINIFFTLNLSQVLGNTEHLNCIKHFVNPEEAACSGLLQVGYAALSNIII